MADVAIFKINYKSDFVLTINSDAGWAIPFCIKFWTASPSQAYFVGFDGTNYKNCRAGETASELVVLFDDHHLPIGNLKMQIAYHATIEEFPKAIVDEVTNATPVITDIDGVENQVMLDFTGETSPELEFDLPAYANEAQRIANEQQRIANEEQRIQNEEAHIAAETIRQQNEAQRIANEEQRIQNEEARIAAETIRQQNEAQRIAQETARVNEFATLKSQSQAATSAANAAAALANDKAQLAADKAALAQAAATLANEKAQLAADKAALANDAAQLANEKAALAQQKAEYAQQQGGYAKDQGDYAKNQGDYAKEQGDTALADHQRAEADHGIAVDDHTQAGNDHTRAESDHGIAVDDHTQAGNDHTRAESDHGTAVDDHTQAGNDHTRAESDHTRAESDHAAVEVYVDSLGAFDISAYHATGGVLANYADLTAALGTNGANIPEGIRKGGMSVKFVQSSDNNYARYNLLAQSFTTDVTKWQSENADTIVTQNSKNLITSGAVFNLSEGFQQSLEDISSENIRQVSEMMEDYQPIVVEGNVLNAPDEEDLTSVNIGGTDVIRFKDKTYNVNLYSGMGRVYLRKNMVNGVNILTQDMFYKGEVGSRVPNTNTIFVIQNDYVISEEGKHDAAVNSDNSIFIGQKHFLIIYNKYSVEINGVTYYYMPVPLKAGHTFKLLDTQNLVLLNNAESILATNTVVAGNEDVTIYVASTSYTTDSWGNVTYSGAGKYHDAFAIGNLYYYSDEIVVSAGQRFKLLNNDCVLITADFEFMYKTQFEASTATSIRVASKVKDTYNNCYSLCDWNTITIPDNCVLEIAGGSISNGIIEGLNTGIHVSCHEPFRNVVLKGNFKHFIKTSYFSSDTSDDDVFDSIICGETSVLQRDLTLTVRKNRTLHKPLCIIGDGSKKTITLDFPTYRTDVAGVGSYNGFIFLKFELQKASCTLKNISLIDNGFNPSIVYSQYLGRYPLFTDVYGADGKNISYDISDCYFYTGGVVITSYYTDTIANCNISNVECHSNDFFCELVGWDGDCNKIVLNNCTIKTFDIWRCSACLAITGSGAYKGNVEFLNCHIDKPAIELQYKKEILFNNCILHNAGFDGHNCEKIQFVQCAISTDNNRNTIVKPSESLNIGGGDMTIYQNCYFDINHDDENYFIDIYGKTYMVSCTMLFKQYAKIVFRNKVFAVNSAFLNIPNSNGAFVDFRSGGIYLDEYNCIFKGINYQRNTVTHFKNNGDVSKDFYGVTPSGTETISDNKLISGTHTFENTPISLSKDIVIDLFFNWNVNGTGLSFVLYNSQNTDRNKITIAQSGDKIAFYYYDNNGNIEYLVTALTSYAKNKPSQNGYTKLTCKIYRDSNRVETYVNDIKTGLKVLQNLASTQTFDRIKFGVTSGSEWYGARIYDAEHDYIL